LLAPLATVERETPSILVGSQPAGSYIVSDKQSATCCHLGKFLIKWIN